MNIIEVKGFRCNSATKDQFLVLIPFKMCLGSSILFVSAKGFFTVLVHNHI